MTDEKKRYDRNHQLQEYSHRTVMFKKNCRMELGTKELGTKEITFMRDDIITIPQDKADKLGDTVEVIPNDLWIQDKYNKAEEKLVHGTEIFNANGLQVVVYGEGKYTMEECGVQL